MSEAIEFEVGFPVINEGDGEDGKSAYEVALEEGFVGTRAEWLLSLKGEDGGGGSGTGNDGKSAYEVALEDGFIGTESEWLLSLKGEDGTDGIDGEDAIDGIDGEDGLDGKSAYEVALEEGFIGTRVEWLLSLKGEDGEDGSGGGGSGGAGGLPKGDWDMEETYNAGDIVQYEGYIFAGKVGSTNEEPIKYVGDNFDSYLVFKNWTLSGKAAGGNVIESGTSGEDYSNYGLMVSDYGSINQIYGEITDKEQMAVSFNFSLYIEENTSGVDKSQITRIGLINNQVGSTNIDDADQWDNFLGLNIESGRADGVIEASIRNFGEVGAIDTEAFKVGDNDGTIKIELMRDYDALGVMATFSTFDSNWNDIEYEIETVFTPEDNYPVGFNFDTIKAMIYSNNTYLGNQNVVFSPHEVQVDFDWQSPWEKKEVSEDWMAIADAPYFYF